ESTLRTLLAKRRFPSLRRANAFAADIPSTAMSHLARQTVGGSGACPVDGRVRQRGQARQRARKAWQSSFSRSSSLCFRGSPCCSTVAFLASRPMAATCAESRPARRHRRRQIPPPLHRGQPLLGGAVDEIVSAHDSGVCPPSHAR